MILSKKYYLLWFLLISICLLLYVLFPYYWMTVSALKPKEELFLSPPTWWPSRIVWTNLLQPWRMFPLGRYYLNSVVVTGLSVLITTVLASMAGYSLSRLRVRGTELIVLFILVTQFLPGIVTIVPFYFWMFRLKLINTYTGLVLAYVAWSLPFSTLMLRAYFVSAYPKELEEAAMIDGCSRAGAYLRIAVPLSLPGLVAVAANTFMIAWKEFLWASIMLSSGSKKTLSVGMRDVIGQAGNVMFISEFMASAVVAVIPAFVFFFVFQRYILSGLAAGSVKG
ncbi:carbohydrate ABC transporter permease [Atrimonas thermophila]|uniref:carbohydrate ABC transporter permease n=1 Tax=Atrimonas thermophila TaxID=3064161 RepID=UPI00399CBA6D